MRQLQPRMGGGTTPAVSEGYQPAIAKRASAPACMPDLGPAMFDIGSPTHDTPARSPTYDRVPGRSSHSGAEAMPEAPGEMALRTFDVESVALIDGARNLAELLSLEPPIERLGTYMVWMIRRLALDDPLLKRVVLTGYGFPPPSAGEPAMANRLARALTANTHCEELLLSNANLRGADECRELANALASNRSLLVLNLESNALEPPDQRRILTAVGKNQTLRELRLCNQFARQAPERQVFQAAEEALRSNRSLCALGLDVTDRHYLEKINRAIVLNFDKKRERRVQAEAAAWLAAKEKTRRLAAGEAEQQATPCHHHMLDDGEEDSMQERSLLDDGEDIPNALPSLAGFFDETAEGPLCSPRPAEDSDALFEVAASIMAVLKPPPRSSSASRRSISSVRGGS